MASKAHIKFEESLGDIVTLLDFHGALEDLSEADGEPMPEGADVLFRSAVLLLVSHWEAYVEDICSEALSHIVLHAPDAASLPKAIKQHVAGELKKASNELEIWQVADEGWRTFLKSRLSEMKEARNRSFNSPKALQTSEFLDRAIGLSDVQKDWRFDGQSSDDVSKELDELIAIRGQIAHRGHVKPKINKTWVEDRVKFIRKVAGRTGGRINGHVKKITQRVLWEPLN